MPRSVDILLSTAIGEISARLEIRGLRPTARQDRQRREDQDVRENCFRGLHTYLLTCNFVFLQALQVFVAPRASPLPTASRRSHSLRTRPVAPPVFTGIAALSRPRLSAR